MPLFRAAGPILVSSQTALHHESIPDQQQVLVIGLDFGTTYSAVSYRLGNLPIQTIDEWPGGHCEDKIPSLIRYSKNHGTSPHWGSKLHWHGEDVVGFKLMLGDIQEKPQWVSRAIVDDQSSLLPANKEAVDIAADFIGSVMTHSMSVIRAKFGPFMTNDTPIELVISMPSEWPTKAKQQTIMAAQRAGYSHINLIEEPVAVALYLCNRHSELTVSEEQTFIICDAGGGTVDVSAIKVLPGAPRPRIEEVIPSRGRMEGSLSLDMAYGNHLAPVAGPAIWRQFRKTKQFLRHLEHFEQVTKTFFRCSEADVALLRQEARTSPFAEHSTLTLPTCKIHAIFDKAVSEIIELLHHQINRINNANSPRGSHVQPVKNIFLAGGFGENPYLYDRLCWEFPDMAIQFAAPKTAVASGAVLSRATDAIQLVQSFSAHYYSIMELAPDQLQGNGQHYAKPKGFFIQIGDKLRVGQQYRQKLNKVLSWPPKAFHAWIVQRDDHPSKWLTAGVDPARPTLDEATWELTIDLSCAEPQHFQRAPQLESGQSMFSIDYVLLIEIVPDAMEIALCVDGQRIPGLSVRSIRSVRQ